jgi:hypothetical protein
MMEKLPGEGLNGPAEEKPEAEKLPVAEPKPEPLKTAVEIALDKIKAEEEKEKLLEKSPEMAEAKKEINDPLSAAIQRFTNRYNIKPEDLAKIPGFNELTGGQKAIVLENFNQISYGKIREGAYARIEKEKQTTGFWGKTKRNLLRAETYNKAEETEAKEFFKGGIKTHGDELKELVRQTKESNLDASFDKNGKLEILFAGRTENLTGKEKEASNRFNVAAAKFAGIGNEWRFSRREKRTFNKVKKEYDASFKELLTAKKEKFGSDEKAALEMIDIDKNVRMSQLLNSNKDVEDALSRAELKTFWQKAWHGTAKERLSYFGVGFVARSVTTSALGLVGAPLVAASLGGYSARKRAIESLKEESLRARGGEKLKTTKKIKTERGNEHIDLLNVVDGIRLTNKIENLIEKIDAATTEEEKSKLRQELSNRLFYTQAKMESGLINFGADKDRLANEYALIAAQGRAEAETGLLNKDVRTAVTERLNQFLEFKENKINAHVRNATIKGVAMAAGFATAGYLVRDLIAEMHGTVTPATGSNFMAPDHTAVATGHVGPMPNEAVPLGETVPAPAPEIHADYTGIVGEHGSAWQAAKSIGLNQKEFADAWANPHSVIHTPEGPVQIHNLNLVHKGDIVKFFPGSGNAPGHFEVLPGSGQPMGTGLPIEHVGKMQPAPMILEKPNSPILPLAKHPMAEESIISTHSNHPAGNPILENQPTPEHTAINETAPAQPLTQEHIITPHHPEIPHPESAPLHHEVIPIHADGINGEVSFQYDASGEPISISQSFNLFGSTGHDYLATENINKLMDYANAHKLDVNYLRESLKTNDSLLLGYIKTYNQLKGNPQYAKEAAFVLKAIQKTVQEIISQYGPDFVKQSNLADFLK